MKKSLPKKPLTIPVIIDDVKDQPGFQMSRCTYFSLASNVPSTDITLDTRINSPSLMVGFVSVICRPSNRSLLFDSPRKISGLFERVEKNQGLYVDINDLWLPNFLFGGLGVYLLVKATRESPFKPLVWLNDIADFAQQKWRGIFEDV